VSSTFLSLDTALWYGIVLVTQKQDIKKQKAKLEEMKKDTEQAKEQARAAARERVLLEFEKGQRSLGGTVNAITISGSDSLEIC
jgi:nitric oxide synthase-interacting protein